jgi:hypothetical protein
LAAPALAGTSAAANIDAIISASAKKRAPASVEDTIDLSLWFANRLYRPLTTAPARTFPILSNHRVAVKPGSLAHFGQTPTSAKWLKRVS